jgi:hypothetical protein
MPSDLTVITPGDCISAEVLMHNFNSLQAQIDTLLESPPVPPSPVGAVLVDGSVAMTGCLVLPDAGCATDNNAVRWGDLRDLLNGDSPFSGSVKQADNTGNAEVGGGGVLATTTASGTVAVSMSGFSSTPVVTVTPGGTTAVILTISALTATGFTVHCFDQAGAPLVSAPIAFNWIAYKG